MRPVSPAGFEKVNWVNYKTGVPHIHFRLDAGINTASVAIEVSHNDVDVRFGMFDKFVQLQSVLEDTSGEKWEWIAFFTDDYGRDMCRVERKIDGVNVMNVNDWPTIISFLKHHIVALDAFWDMVKPGFE